MVCLRRPYRSLKPPFSSVAVASVPSHSVSVSLSQRRIPASQNTKANHGVFEKNCVVPNRTFYRPCVNSFSQFYSSNCVVPSKVKQVSWKPRAFVYEGFLTEEECEHLISHVSGWHLMHLLDSIKNLNAPAHH